MLYLKNFLIGFILFNAIININTRESYSINEKLSESEKNFLNYNLSSSIDNNTKSNIESEKLISYLENESRSYLSTQNQKTQVPENLKIAFIGDAGIKEGAEEVLDLIKRENAEMIMHQGDFDYLDSPEDWEKFLNKNLGEDFPYFASLGNHDAKRFYGKNGYQEVLKSRYEKVKRKLGDQVNCTGEFGVKSSCFYKGLYFINSGVGTLGDGHVEYIKENLASNKDLTWKICSWHKNQSAMQIGSKSNEVGWGAYEECRKGGAIIATGHEHSYCRSRSLIDFPSQIVDPNYSEPKNVRVTKGSTFAFVSGLGGKSLRNQERCKPYYFPYGCHNTWGSIYSVDQDATYAALFCEFNKNGVQNKASCYYKNIKNEIIDDFEVLSFPEEEFPTSNFKRVESTINYFSDDAEEYDQNSKNVKKSKVGKVNTNSRDLDIGSQAKIVGLRFNNLRIPLNSIIKSAKITFQVEDDSHEITKLIEISAEKQLNPPTFDDDDFDISRRVLTNNKAQWRVEVWEDEDKNDWKSTSDLKELIQEVIEVNKYSDGILDSIVFVLKSNDEVDSKREVISFDRLQDAAPRLVVEYE